MKKTLLSMLAVCAVIGASAAVTDLNGVWNKSLESTEDMVWNAPVAVDAAGNVYAAGAFDKEFAPAGVTLTPVGTSAYITKMDVNGGVQWAVAITGAATVSAIDVDGSGNVYVAGVYADEITFGTTSGDEIVKEGQMVDGAPTSKLNSSFIAKYDANGAVKAVETFIPEGLPELVATGMYSPMDGDVFFHINHIGATDNGILASAIYTGYTKNGDAEFKGSYNDPWFGAFYMDLRGAAVFKLNNELEACEVLASCGTQGSLATEDALYQPSSVTFQAAGDYNYIAFAGNGPLVITPAKGDAYTAESDTKVYNYIVVSTNNDGSLGLTNAVAAPEAGFNALNVPVEIYSDKQGNVNLLGYEAFAENYGTDNERISNQVFVINNVFANPRKLAMELINGNVNYYEISSATVTPDGAVLASLLGYYTDKVEGEHSKGDFAKTSQVYALMGTQVFPVPNSGMSYGVAAAGAYAAMSQISNGGVTFTLFNDPTGIEGVVVDSNAAVEYFNLQGVRVDNPANGVFIRRQGTTATKVMVK